MAIKPERTRPKPTPQPPYPKSRPLPEKDKGEQKQKSPLQALAKDKDGKAATYKTWERLKKEGKRRRDPWVPLWTEVYDYTLPNRESFFGTAAGEQRTDLIYDETAVQGIPKLASRLVAGFFPEFGQIFDLEYGDEAPQHLRGFAGQAKLQLLTSMIHSSWRSSNLFTEIGEAMTDYAIGTVNICQEPGFFPGEVRFKSVPPTHIGIVPGPFSSVRAWPQWRKMALEDIADEYPDADLPREFERRRRQDPRQEVQVDYMVWAEGSPIDPAYKQIVVLEEFKAIIDERTLRGEGACPWATGRWSKAGMEAWGRGPILLTMPAIKTCNLTVQMLLENAEMALGGVWTYDNDGVFNPDNVSLSPGTFIAKGVNSKVEPLTSSANFNVSDLVLADMRMNIKKSLFIDELDTPGQTPRSAFENQARLAEISRSLSNPGSRLAHEVIVPMVNRTIWIFEKQGILDAAGLRVDGKRLKLHVRSPFLRGQNQITVNEWMTAANQMNFIYGPGTAGLAFKPSGISEIARLNGISAQHVNSPDQITALIAGAAKAAAESGAVGGEGGVDPVAAIKAMTPA